MKTILAIAMVVTGTPLLAAPAQDAASSTPNPIVVTGTPPPRPPRQICRRVAAMSGSHVSRVRMCRTAAEWRALSDISADDSQETLETLTVAQARPVDGYTAAVPPAERPGPVPR